jgi:hypothetical protein
VTSADLADPSEVDLILLETDKPPELFTQAQVIEMLEQLKTQHEAEKRVLVQEIVLLKHVTRMAVKQCKAMKVSVRAKWVLLERAGTSRYEGAGAQENDRNQQKDEDRKRGSEKAASESHHLVFAAKAADDCAWVRLNLSGVGAQRKSWSVKLQYFMDELIKEN